MTEVDCTQQFIHFREIARHVWNVGFWPDPELLEFASARSYDEAMARLFEGMVLRRLGFGHRLNVTLCQSEPVAFYVKVSNAVGIAELQARSNIDPNWIVTPVKVGRGRYRLRFIDFFDWYWIWPRHYGLLDVLIEDFEERPDLVGRKGMIDFDDCSSS